MQNQHVTYMSLERGNGEWRRWWGVCSVTFSSFIIDRLLGLLTNAFECAFEC